LVAKLAGRPVALDRMNTSEQLRNAFWYLPEEHVADIVIRAPVDAVPDVTEGTDDSAYTDVELSLEGEEEFVANSSFALGYRYGEFARTPPTPSIERVSGKGATAYNYWNNGRTDFLRFSEIAERHGVETFNPSTRILDWGCGCARLTRHWMTSATDADKVVGIDIDPVNIEWCNSAFKNASFEVCPLAPPANLKGPFDLIVGNSVLTHLKQDVMEAWLSELAAQLKPNGVALLSYHGDFSLAAICSRNQEFCERVYRTGFDASIGASELNDAIDDKTYYRQTFMTDEFAQALFQREFTVKEVHVGVVSRYQNVAVLTPKT
ncbi:MAG: class I SAM-dependent methyltransferase, partial [Pseudomonadota bacterium]